MKSSPVFRGSGTAVITPFINDRIDYESFAKIIEFQIRNGTDALIICGTTGEAATLTEDERREVIAFAVSQSHGRIPVIAGTGCNETSRAVIRSKEAYAAGADALLVVTPYYNKASSEGLFRHYKQIALSADLPVILYNVPSRTGVNIPIPVYKRLMDIDNIVAVKEASGNLEYALELMRHCGDKLDLYSGNDSEILPLLSIGGIGVISVISNLLPKQTHDLCCAWFDKQPEKALEMQLGLLDIMKTMFIEVNPIPVKTALALMGFCREEFRLPLCPMEESNRILLESVLKENRIL